jgi:hypothetical protein
MSETIKNKNEYEPTPDGLRYRLEDLGNRYLAYTQPAFYKENSGMLTLETKHGERIIIEKSIEGMQPEGHFFQDLIMSVLAGHSTRFHFEQVDYNFNQYGDGLLRKRIVSGRENGVVDILPGMSSNAMARAGRLTLQHALEGVKNMKLEEDMGLNNQPATDKDINEAFRYLDEAVVLDPKTLEPVPSDFV